jgi:hypothetical protein
MLKSTFFNILFYLFLKYLVAYVVFMIMTKNYAMLQVKNLKNTEDILLYLWLVLFIPIVNVALFSLPYYFSFKLKSGILFFLSIALILFLEYLFYVYLNSQKHIDTNGIIVVLISIVIFYLFFFKRINTYFS